VPAGFVPTTGALHRFSIPAAPGIRVDTGFRDGSVVSPHYDAMLAKVIAHGRTRGDAARRLARALRQAEIHGLTTNRDLLIAILREPEFLAGGTDTGYLTRHQPAALAAASPAATATHALAAALARQARHRAEAPVLAAMPSGWRNVFSAPQRVTYTAAGEPYAVAYRLRGDTVHAEVNDASIEALVRAATPGQVDLEIDGTRRLYRVHQVGADSYVDASDGSSALSEIPRFGDPTKLAPAGSLLAPMPGLVLRVLAEPGAVVTAGQPLLVLEAMKMEQTVSAPADGVVAELRAKAGEQVSTGQVLAVLEPASPETGD
jgi:acyl-CoA carboxylase subunit alpha